MREKINFSTLKKKLQNEQCSLNKLPDNYESQLSEIIHTNLLTQNNKIQKIPKVKRIKLEKLNQKNTGERITKNSNFLQKIKKMYIFYPYRGRTDQINFYTNKYCCSQLNFLHELYFFDPQFIVTITFLYKFKLPFLFGFQNQLNFILLLLFNSFETIQQINQYNNHALNQISTKNSQIVNYILITQIQTCYNCEIISILDNRFIHLHPYYFDRIFFLFFTYQFFQYKVTKEVSISPSYIQILILFLIINNFLMLKIFLFALLTSLFCSSFVSGDIQLDYITLIGTNQSQSNYSYSYQYMSPFKHTPNVLIGVSDFSISPTYNYIYFYVGTWNNGDLASQQFYFSNYQITQFNIHFIAVDPVNINFISIQYGWYYYSPTFSYGTGPRSFQTDINYPMINSTTTQNLISHIFVNYIDIYSPDDIHFNINSSVVNNQTVKVLVNTDGNTNVWGYNFGLIVIDKIAINQTVGFNYAYIDNTYRLSNIPVLRLTFVGVTGFNIERFMDSFRINIELATNNFILSPNIVLAKFSMLTFFNSVSSNQVTLAKQIQFAVEVVGLAIVVISIYANRMLGLQLIAVLQTAFFMLSSIDYVPEIINTMNQYYLAINGYNRLFQDFPVIPWGLPINYQYANIPAHLQNIHYQAEFLFNINYMLGLNIIIFLLGALLRILHFPQRFSNFIGKDLFFGFTLFNAMNIGFSIGAHMNYFTRDTKVFYGNNLCVLAALVVLALAAFTYASRKEDQLVGYVSHYKQGWQNHPLYHFGHKLLIALGLGFFTQFKNLTYVIAGVAGVYLLYIILVRPYKVFLLQLRAFVNETAICLIAGVALYYQNYTDDNIVNTTQYLAWVEVGFIAFTVALSLLVLIKQFYLRCTQKTDSKVEPEEKPAEEVHDVSNSKLKIQNAQEEQEEEVGNFNKRNKKFRKFNNK